MEIRTASQAIDALGGTAKVARMFATKLSRQAVSNWRLATRGLPPDTFYVLGPALRRKRHVFTPCCSARNCRQHGPPTATASNPRQHKEHPWLTD